MLSTKPRAKIPVMAKQYLLVDAHNVIFAQPDLAARHRGSPAAAREELVRLLERHQDASGVRVVVVFDGGSGAKASSHLSGAAGVQVIYAQAGQSADAMIERLVLKYGQTHQLTVATNDNLIRTAAAAAGAATIGSETLFEEIRRAEDEMRGTLQQLRRRR